MFTTCLTLSDSRLKIAFVGCDMRLKSGGPSGQRNGPALHPCSDSVARMRRSFGWCTSCALGLVQSRCWNLSPAKPIARPNSIPDRTS